MASNAYSYTQARQDDTAQRLLRKIAAALFVSGQDPRWLPQLGDTEQRLLFKIVSILAGAPRMDDTAQRLAYRWCLLLFIAGSDPKFQPRMDDTYQRLLWKIASLLFVTGMSDTFRPRANDTQQRLLWKIASILQSNSPAALPNKAVTPFPANGDTGIAAAGVTLSWVNGGGATSYDVWFNGVFQGNQVGTTFATGALSDSTNYSWRIDSVNAAGTTAGDSWSFVTAAPLITWTPDTVGGTYNAGTPFANLAAFRAIDPATVTTLNLSASAITTLTGVQSLPALTILAVGGCASLTTLDVSGCSGLEQLSCDSGGLTSLNVAGCSALTYLGCDSNALTSLDVTGCVALTEIACQNNALTTLDVTDCVALTTLYCFSNLLFIDLDLSGNPNLSTMDCGGNLLIGTLDLDPAAANIMYCNCASNNLDDVSMASCATLSYLDCSFNPIGALDVSEATNIAELYFSGISGPDVTIGDSTSYIMLTGIAAHMNVASVNGALVSLEANSLYNVGTLDFTGANAAPSGVGLNARANLESEGWVCATN
jgi:hypothetical protein